MKIYAGNLQSVINCDELISTITIHNVISFNEFMSLPKDHPYYEDVNKQAVSLKNVGYDSSSVEYRHYQSGKHFDKNISEEFGKLVGATPLLCWISEIRPGKCTPWHWDVNPWEHGHKQLGDLVRYFCFLSKPAPGHIFVTEQDAYYNEPQGTIYQYEDIHAWHAGSNVGLIPKFLLTFTGYK
jgi:hypothetical protein